MSKNRRSPTKESDYDSSSPRKDRKRRKPKKKVLRTVVVGVRTPTESDNENGFFSEVVTNPQPSQEHENNQLEDDNPGDVDYAPIRMEIRESSLSDEEQDVEVMGRPPSLAQQLIHKKSSGMLPPMNQDHLKESYKEFVTFDIGGAGNVQALDASPSKKNEDNQKDTQGKVLLNQATSAREMNLADLTDPKVFDMAQTIDHRLEALKEQVLHLGSQLDLEKEPGEFLDEIQSYHFNQMQFKHLGLKVDSEPLNQEALDKTSKLPSKSIFPPLAESLSKQKSQTAYLESLNLKETAHQTFEVLQEALTQIRQYFNPNNQAAPIDETFNSYMILSDLTQQKEFLNNFNQNFKRVVTHILEVDKFLVKKEESYIKQIESLSRQNQFLFDENIELQDKLGELNLLTDYGSRFQNNTGINQTKSLSGQNADQAGIIEEISTLLVQRFDMIKQQLWDGDSSTCFYSNDLMSIPKSFKHITVEDPLVHKALSHGLDQVESLRTLLKDSLDKKNAELNVCRREGARIADRYLSLRKTLDLVLQKTLPRAKVLLEVDKEFLDRTIVNNKAVLSESIQLLRQKKRDKPDEDVEAKKVTSMNLILCHQQVIDKINDCFEQLLSFNSSGRVQIN